MADPKIVIITGAFSTTPSTARYETPWPPPHRIGIAELLPQLANI
jgi:hypothetical protein